MLHCQTTFVILNQDTLRSLTYKGQPVLTTESETGPASPGILVYFVAAALIVPIVAAVGIIYVQKEKPADLLSERPTKIGVKRESVHDRLSPFCSRIPPAGDKIFRFIVIGAVDYYTAVGLAAISIFSGSAEVFYREGVIEFITGTDWNAVEGRESYGALPYIVGMSKPGIAMIIGVPIS